MVPLGVELLPIEAPVARLFQIVGLLVVVVATTGCMSPMHDNLPVGVEMEMPPEVYVQVGGLRVRKPVQSWQGLQRENVVMQKYDYSCGAAALTTLLKHYFGDQVTEQKVLQAIFLRLADRPDAEAVVRDRYEKGLSMLDLFTAAKDLGYQAAVANIPLKQLAKSQAPVIVRIEKNDYKHFVVFRGIVEDRVFLADPIRGNLRMDVIEFNKQWTLANDQHIKYSGDDPARPVLFLGKAGFGLPKVHPLAVLQSRPVRIEVQSARQAIFHGP